jgi:multidrug efflux pump
LIKLIILIAQYNSIYFTFVTISAVALSLTGVFLALVLTAQPFGIVMCGLGVISLMGIVVSNNIIFIDTYQKMIAEGGDKLRSIVETARQRIRPILLTTITTIIGLIPMVLNINIDLLGVDIIFNAPSGEIWQQLSLTIASGLIASTILSLVFTPAMLAMRAKKSQR